MADTETEGCGLLSFLWPVAFAYCYIDGMNMMRKT